MEEIKETISKGQAVDIADANLYNDSVESVSLSGNKENKRYSGVVHTPRREVDFNADLDYLSVDINGLYSYRDEVFKQRVYVTDRSWTSGIQVYGYAITSSTDRKNRDEASFSIAFDNREQVIQFANKCLDMLLIQEETTALVKRYKDVWNKHPDALAHFPSLLDQTKCMTGRYYWDASLNKAIEITKDTDADILDAHPDYDTDNEGNFEPTYTNEESEELLAGLLVGIESGWDNDNFNGIRVADLQTGIGSYSTGQGIVRNKGKNPEDKRKKQWTTTFYYTDGTSETKIGYWERHRHGNVQRLEWKE